MRAVQHTGRRGTAVIPPAWSEAPRVVFARTHTAKCSVRRPGGVKGDFDEETGTYPITPATPHFTGPCRVQVLSTQEREALVAEQNLTTVGYRILVDLDASDVQVDDVVTVTCFDANGDPLLEDQEFYVKSFDRSSMQWERSLLCSDNLG